MSREELPREDLLAEATALVDRAELAIAGFESPVVVGFRRNGSPSFYFGDARAYHFNSRGELRRAFIDPLLYKADRERLYRLLRRREARETVLISHELSADEQVVVLNQCAGSLMQLAASLAAGEYQLQRQVSLTGNVVARAEQWLARNVPPIRIARSPRVG